MDWRDRLAARMEELGLRPADVTRRAGVNPTMIHDIMKRRQTPSIDNIARLAAALGMTLGELYSGDEPLSLTVVISGVTSGRGMWSEYGSRDARQAALSLLGQDYVAVEVVDDSLTPRFDRGDIIAGPKVAGTHLDNLIGLDCIAELTTGARHVGILTKGSRPNMVTIRAFNPRVSDENNVLVKWAAPVQLVLRGAT